MDVKCLRVTYQKAVEELMHEEAQDTDDGIAQMVDKEHVHNHCLVASSECSLVSHKTHKKHNFVEELKDKKTSLWIKEEGENRAVYTFQCKAASDIYLH